MVQQTKNRKVVTIGLLAALFIGALDATVVSTAMPHITKELSGFSLISWVFSIYTLMMCVATPVFGKLADLYGRKSVFTAGLIIFAVGSILCGAATSMTAMIWFRAIQGLGAGALTPVTFTIVGDLYPGEQRAKVQGIFSSVWSIAGLLGPLVGGTFVDYISWRWIFYMNVPVFVIAFIFVVGFLHEKFEKKSKSIDYSGAILFTIGLSALLYALLNGGEKYAWNSALIISLFCISAVALSLFLFAETRVKEPMMPLALFKTREIRVIYLLSFLGFAVTAGVMVYAPQWIQIVLGHSATNSGFTLMPMCLAWPFAATMTGRLMFKYGPRLFIVSGAFVVAAGSLWLMLIDSNSPYSFLVGILVLIGLGMGLLATPILVLIQNAVDWSMRGVATSTNSLMNALGQTVGVAIFGTLFNNAAAGLETEQVAHGMHAVFIAIFVVSIAVVLVVGLLPSQRKESGKSKSSVAGG
ncbi:MDR family MFS transporter [Paenibacillus glycanilyticus]|uniref:MFS transporter n=1 Tax=Paenibacillus glycanilyticus TaxID=126569 RepID=A0ABQ6GIA5_9BACL|nr:MDR family MFS transporter [Paenibacillus glycanilyticus]GLX70422.1 MFS transporter [Paenibacillus glycanilyticus]